MDPKKDSWDIATPVRSLRQSESITRPMAKNRYGSYLRTNRWRDKRQNAFLVYGRRCSDCGHSGSKKNPLHVHHKTYERFGGEERIEDLQVLCSDCHNTLHGARPKPPKKATFRETRKPNKKQRLLRERANKPRSPKKRRLLSKQDGTPPELKMKYEVRRKQRREAREASK